MRRGGYRMTDRLFDPVAEIASMVCRGLAEQIDGQMTAMPMGQAVENGRTWCCRFHPTDWFHEVGCPHVAWDRGPDGTLRTPPRRTKPAEKTFDGA